MLESAELLVFLTAARHLNFASAARELRLSPSQVSKEIARTEEKLGRLLFLRTTRRVRLTSEGEMLVPLAQRALDAMADAADLFGGPGDDTALTGTIRVTCSHALAARKIAGMAADFCAIHPNVAFDFVLSDGYLDLIDERIDLAVRIMGLSDSSLIARRLARNGVIFCASPDYLASREPPRSVADLAAHDVYFIPQHGDLRFRRARIKLAKAVQPPRIHAQSGDFLVEIARQGGGILVRSDWSVERELDKGHLVTLELDDELVSETSIYAVYPSQKTLPRRTRLWIDHMAERFASRSTD
jgi:DNA-binding transcriptional LysR family regulator